MPGVIGIIQGRIESTRLPGKLLAPLAGRPLLEVLATRVAGATVDEWWLATSTRPADDAAASVASDLGLRVFRGDPDDVLSRFTAIVDERRPDLVARLTGDDPFTDAGVVDALIGAAGSLPDGIDHVGEDPGARRLPLGYACEVVRATALVAAAAAIPAGAAHHRVHVTSWLRAQHRSIPFSAPGDWPMRPGWRWTVDTTADLAMARATFDLFGDRWSTIGYPEMVAVLDAHPDVAAMNAGVAQKALVEG